MTQEQRNALIAASTPENVERLIEALHELRLEINAFKRCHGKLPVYQEQCDRADAALAPFKGVKP